MIVVIQIPNPVLNPLKITDVNKAIATLVLGISDLTGDQLRNLTIPSGKIADSAITSAKILDGSVGTVKIEDGCITEAKLHADYKTALTALLNGKAGVDFDNVTDSAKEKSVDWAMPDFTRGESRSKATVYQTEYPALVVIATAATASGSVPRFDISMDGVNWTMIWYGAAAQIGDTSHFNQNLPAGIYYKFYNGATFTAVEYPMKGV